MIIVKRIYSFVLSKFLPLLLATFSVCLFLLLMHFVWMYVNDMVGKGVDVIVLGELFFYAGITFISMALPLSILLASLITFGNLGEHFELLAMKASGISLLRIMKPLVFTCLLFTFLSFYVQNKIVPKAKVKMATIIVSLRQKSPELDIPEREFYKEITNYNMYVRHKDKKSGYLLDVMINDYSKGFENAAVIVADTGKLSISDDKKNLILTLYSGELFQNWKNRKNYSMQENIPYRRETFSMRTMLIPFDANFNMVDESLARGRDMGKTFTELTGFIDSLRHETDSINRQNAPYFKRRIYAGAFKQTYHSRENPSLQRDTLFAKGFQSYIDNLNIDRTLNYVNKARNKVDNIMNEYSFNSINQYNTGKTIRSHRIQLQSRYTLSLACLLFFFIGAPLGAIIRRGGLGMPSVLSVLLFVFYYTIDTLGIKMAKQGFWPVWEGVWLSTAVLTALGIFLSYKAVNDSVIMNPDAWKTLLQRLLGKREIRNYARKEVIMEYPDYLSDLKKIEEWNTLSQEYLLRHGNIPFYTTFWKRSKDEKLEWLVQMMDLYMEDLLNSDNILIINKLMDYPVVKPALPEFLNKPQTRWTCAILLPVGLILYSIGFFRQRRINNDLKMIYKVNEEVRKIVNGE